MKRTNRLVTGALIWLALLQWVLPVHGQMQQDLAATLYATNYSRGVNLVSSNGPPIVSGATSGQFSNVVSVSALAMPTQGAALIPGSNYVGNAVALNLPRVTVNGQITLVLRSASAGFPTYGQLASFAFGAVIPPPDQDIGGALLANPGTFWAAEPYSVNGHTNAPYYWSPHARKVFATQPGPIQVTWRKAEPATNTLSGLKTNIGGRDFALTNVSYLVSGAAAKTPRKLYWTEKGFRATGKPVSVPRARVSAIYFHYNSTFPKTVESPYVELGSSSPTDGSKTAVLQELRTTWYDDTQGLILAYNREGRVFLELLGDSNGDDTRKHLGYEIVDVIRQPVSADRVAELGDKISAYDDGQPDLDLLPDPLLTSLSDGFLYRDSVGSNGRVDFYAVKETVNANDSLVHWLEEGEVGLHWPAILARYRQVWPEDVSRYSHYVRPEVGSRDAAEATAVTLPGDNIPFLQYQDPLDQPRGRLNERSLYFTWLDADHPYHRALIRLSAGDRVAFERVLSLLQAKILDAQVAPGAPSDSVVRFNPVYSRDRDGRFLTAPWTGDSSSGIGPGTVWAARFGSNQGTNINGVTVTGYPGPGTTNSNFELSGATSVYTGDANELTTGSGGSKVIGSTFIVGGAPRLKLLNLEPGHKYVLSIFSVGWDAQAERQIMFSSDGDSSTINQTRYGLDKGIRIDYTFTPSSSQRSIHMDPVLPGVTFHLYGISLWKGELASGTLPLERITGLGPDTLKSYPRYVQQTVSVGDRIDPPTSEADDLAGHIHEPSGNSFHATAYRDPLDPEVGFEAAKQGAIIPVNAIPGSNLLEVWWFRANRTDAVKNSTNGFKAIYWPSVVGRYSVAWPGSASEIVMAGNAGSGALESLQAKGTIYTQNHTNQSGYNPNEEHALMIGGQAYALRDDLNITNGPAFSSLPYVLLDYTAEDGRPAVRPFKVRREKPEAGMLFDYVVEAGTQLQAPMPLPLLPAPVGVITNTSGIIATNYNRETAASTTNLPAGWTSSSATGPYAGYAGFTYRDRKESFWVMRGPHAGLPKLEAGVYPDPSGPFSTNITAGGALTSAFTNYIHTSRRIDSLVATVDPATPLPAGLRFGPLRDGLAVYGALSANAGTYTLIVTDADGSVARVRLTLNAAPFQRGPLNLNGRLGRPPSLAQAAPAAETIPTNALGMRFYYVTQEGFAWPGPGEPPPVGTIVPYLRPAKSDGSFHDTGGSSTFSVDQ